MKALLAKRPYQIAIYLFLDLISIALGMGVPFFTILFGFPVGLVIPGLIRPGSELSPQYLASLLRAALISCAVTLVVLGLLWLPTLGWLFDPARDLANFGIPMILYTPRASYIGWMILMVLISPFLQFLMMVFGSISRIVFWPGRWIPETGDSLPGR